MAFTSKICFIFFLFSISISHALKAQLNSSLLEQFMEKEGLPGSQVNAVAVDKYGYIWFGTVTGVNRYNGYSVKSFENIQGDPCALYSGGTRSLLCDSDGGLWVGMLGGLVKYDYSKDCFIKYGDSTLNWVNKILEAQPWQIYLAWNGGLAKINTQNNQITYYDGLKCSIATKIPAIYDIAQMGRELYLATATGIFTFNPDTEHVKAI